MSPKSGEVRKEFCHEKAQEVLTEYSRGRPSLKPPINIESIADSLGFQVVWLYTVSEEFSGIVSTRQKLIGVNGKHHRHRRRFTIGHELAHILLKHPPESHCTSREIDLYNAEADECAAELLIPSTLLTQWRPITPGVKNLACTFDVSKEAMAVKLRQIQSQKYAPTPTPMVK